MLKTMATEKPTENTEKTEYSACSEEREKKREKRIKYKRILFWELNSLLYHNK
jgi:hypothetical protein